MCHDFDRLLRAAEMESLEEELRSLDERAEPDETAADPEEPVVPLADD